MTATLAVDIGGTKIAAATVIGDQVEARVVIPTRTETMSPTDSLRRAVAQALSRSPAKPTVVAIASAGPIDVSAGTIRPLNVPEWINLDLRAILRDEISQLDVVLVGDAIALAAAEHRFGAARGCNDVICITISTGVGAALVLGGHVRLGPHHSAGHLGHTVIDPAGSPCRCGNRGCLETAASGPSMVAWAQSHGWCPNEHVEAPDLFAAALSGNPVANQAILRATDALAAAISSAAALIDLDAVIVGGGVTLAGDGFLGPLSAALDQLSHRVPFMTNVTLRVSQLGPDGGLIGAALLAQDSFPPVSL